MLPRAKTCFFEEDPQADLARRAMVEGLGSLLLMLVAAGSGLAMQHMLRQTTTYNVVASAISTAGALVGLIFAFGSVSGGHFNPLITVLQGLARERNRDCVLAYVTAQCAGAIAGALLLHLLFKSDESPLHPPTASWPLSLSEAVASAGLMIVVFGCARSGRTETGPIAVGAWLCAAIIATPSASCANPALAIAASIVDGPMASSGSKAFSYVLAEVAGALLAFLVIRITHPTHSTTSSVYANLDTLEQQDAEH